MIRAIVVIGLVAALAGLVVPEDYLLNETLDLAYTTSTDDSLTWENWDTAYVVISQGGTAVDTIGLIKGTTVGTWYGTFALSSLARGSYNREFYAVYTGEDNDTTCEILPFSILDSTAFHGAASGLTPSEIADTLALRGYFKGVGDRTIRIKVMDESDSSGIGVVNVRMFAWDDTLYRYKLAWTATGADGYTVPFLRTNLDSALFNFFKTGCELDDTIYVIGDSSGLATYERYGTDFSPPVAVEDSMAAVWGYVYDTEDAIVEDVWVKFTLVSPTDWAKIGNKVYLNIVDSTQTNSSGYFSVDKIWNSRFTPSGTYYQVDMWKANVTLEDWSKYIVVPDTNSINVNDM